ncbi:MAG: phosphonate metabolism protein/1,5-bisphosphokinase (PRPP-forming) PhnN [Rhizobiales bacterium]|nr:phosphonate metabolism protein/1,5-bisphosphokinase (PRPP-forming) PhnN [Hyphomicrobiales bacterium]
MSPAAMVPQTGLRGGGVVVAVVGPSGAGKDSLIAAARRQFAGNSWVVFPRRIVTRDALPAAEPHETASVTEFDAIEAAGAFSVSWRAHGHAYGIATSMEDDLRHGCVVVINVSRQVIDALRRRFERVQVVFVTAEPAVLEARLRARGRESDGEIARRVARAIALGRPSPPVTVIDNSGVLSDAAEVFNGVVSSYAPAGYGEANR